MTMNDTVFSVSTNYELSNRQSRAEEHYGALILCDDTAIYLFNVNTLT